MTELDPGARLVIDFVKNAGGPPLCTLSPAEARMASNAARATLQPPPPDVTEVRDFEATGRNGVIPMRLYRNAPPGSNLAGLVFFHGGGFVVGDLDSHDVLCRQLAIMMQCVVIAVHYRRAPSTNFQPVSRMPLMRHDGLPVMRSICQLMRIDLPWAAIVRVEI